MAFIKLNRSNNLSANSKAVNSFRSKLILYKLVFILCLPIAAAVVYYSYNFYNQSSIFGTTGQETAPGALLDELSDEAATADPINGAPGSVNGNGGLTSPPPPGPGLQAPTPDASVPMPSSVSAIISSIEDIGLVDNPHVIADTSDIPSGSTVKVNRDSWRWISSETGNVDGALSYLGYKVNGVLVFNIIDGKWLVIAINTDS
jgi:hypothetical protein